MLVEKEKSKKTFYLLKSKLEWIVSGRIKRTKKPYTFYGYDHRELQYNTREYWVGENLLYNSIRTHDHTS